MNIPNELKIAIRTLQNECDNHKKCLECPLWQDGDCMVYHGGPVDWRLPNEN